MRDGAPPSDGAPPRLAAPPRPQRPLTPLQLLRTVASNTVGIFDEALFDELVVVRRYGPVRLAFVSDPAAIRQVLVDRFDDYPRVPMIKRLYAAEIGTGTLATSGAIWWRHRRICAATLDRRATAPDLPGLIAQCEALVAGFEPLLAEPVDIEAQAARIWIQLLNRMSAGGDLDFVPILKWLSRVPRKPRALDLLPMPEWLRDRVSSARQSPERIALRAQLAAMIAARKAAGYAGPRDLLWRIAHSADRATGETLPPNEMADEAASLVGAGDATIRALTWIWYLLGTHPAVEARLHAELDAVLGDGPLRPEQLRQLPYLRRVLDEVMRLYPPIPIIARVARVTDTIAGKKVPRGTFVIVAPWVVHRHRRLWDEPERFDPDRFTEARSADRPRFAHLPFAVGPGVCPGSHFAQTQMMVIAAAIARRYRFHLAPDADVVPFGAISLQPRGGLWGALERR